MKPRSKVLMSRNPDSNATRVIGASSGRSSSTARARRYWVSQALNGTPVGRPRNRVPGSESGAGSDQRWTTCPPNSGHAAAPKVVEAPAEALAALDRAYLRISQQPGQAFDVSRRPANEG